MSHPMLPTRPITLTSSHFTVPSSHPDSQSLKVQVRPHLLVQAGLVPPLARGNKVEEWVQVIVPVGGKVEVSIEVNTEGLSGPKESAQEQLRGKMNEHLLGILRNSHESLGLSLLEPVIIPSSSSSRIARYLLNPSTASPTHNILSKTIVPSGTPIAFLTRLHIELSWVNPALQNRRKSLGDQPKSDDNDQQEGEEEEEEFLPLDDPEDLNGPEEAIVAIVGGSEDEEFLVLNDTVESTSVFEEQGDEEYGWAVDQMHEGIDRLLRTHFIRRFPLIFDGGFLEYTSTLDVPRSLVSSIAHLLHLASIHSPGFADAASKGIKGISSSQQTTLRDLVDQAASLPARRPKRKKSRNDSQSSGGPESQKPGSGQNTPAAEDEGLMDDEVRTNSYLGEIKRARKEWEDQGGRKAEKRLHRIVGDALGVIGRAVFEGRRKRGGRMGYNQIPLEYGRRSPAPVRVSSPSIVSDQPLTRVNDLMPLPFQSGAIEPPSPATAGHSHTTPSFAESLFDNVDATISPSLDRPSDCSRTDPSVSPLVPDGAGDDEEFLSFPDEDNGVVEDNNDDGEPFLPLDDTLYRQVDEEEAERQEEDNTLTDGGDDQLFPSIVTGQIVTLKQKGSGTFP